ncbi:MAG: GNAT family N-acetyltransferase [Natronomonas sp.]
MSVKEFIRSIGKRFRPRRITPRRPPEVIHDERGGEVDIRPFTGDPEELTEMYDSLDSTSRAQGVPPRDEPAIRTWLEDLLDGTDVVARHDGQVIGHVSFVPDGTGRHELSIFVRDEYQGLGIGTALLSAGLGQARADGVRDVWLSVSTSERRLQRFYARAGFSVVNPMGITYRMSRTL